MLNPDEPARQAGAPEPFTWAARARLPGGDPTTAAAAIVHVGRQVFSVGGQAGFDTSGTILHPSAVEYLLGALAADLLSGFVRAASRRGVALDAIEASVSGRLNNPLVHLGVVGETGHPGLEEARCTLYVSAADDRAESLLHEVWEATLAASPLAHTLRRGIPALFLQLSILP